MAARGPRPMVLLLSALLCLCLVQLTQGASFRQFVNNHVNEPKTAAPNNNAYCNRLMQQRGMTRPRCKLSNTFIHAPINQIRAICTNGGRRFRRNLFDSHMSFSLTVCRLVNRRRGRSCVYTGRSQTRRIRVGCVNQLPVHFERIL
ncbi:ribonuclease [Alligator mississippiensis]|uniref:ribonuclease n=1 Tax=Alligator mississippiensis TaxID=8496 RepID=UPI0028776240|nr:ribonuclease [Alligator mississippiensis]